MWNRSLHLLCLLAVSLALSLPASADPKAGQNAGQNVGQKIGLDARLALPVMEAGAQQKNYLRVALQGCRPEPNQARTPVNVAFVIDRSGSMQGDRIAQAKAAAIMAVSRLDHRDIASVVMFDDTADVVMQAQPVAQLRPVRRRHPADLGARLDRHPRRRADRRQRGAPLQGAATAQSRHPAVGRPGQPRPIAPGRFQRAGRQRCCARASRSARSASASATTRI